LNHYQKTNRRKNKQTKKQIQSPVLDYQLSVSSQEIISLKTNISHQKENMNIEFILQNKKFEKKLNEQTKKQIDE
jgi:hypothetical protein